MKGYLDGVTRRKVRGWAKSDDGNPAELLASINGVASIRFRASLSRPDLVDFDRKDLGFDVEVDRLLNPGDVVSVTNNKGEHLTGSPRTITSLDGSKEEKALWFVSRDMKVLEIGPCYNPVAPRSQGWNSFSLDHATQKELQDKYRGAQAIERIEPVDYIWKSGTIETAIPEAEHGSFDVLIASHVLEHIPDPIGFFRTASVLLKPEGLVSLILPDKRLMFDFFKSVTTTSDYLLAHHLGRTRHSKKTAFDNIACNVAEKGDVAWFTREVGNFSFFGENTLVLASQAFESIIEDESGPYVDFHATIYTPSSFALIVFELSQLGILPFVVAQTFPTVNCEFYVTLRKGVPAMLSASEVDAERLRLMKLTIRELAQQAQWLSKEE